MTSCQQQGNPPGTLPDRQGTGASAHRSLLASALQQRIAGLQAELDETVAAQCPLCSTLMVDTIDLELENSEDRSWDL